MPLLANGPALCGAPPAALLGVRREIGRSGSRPSRARRALIPKAEVGSGREPAEKDGLLPIKLVPALLRDEKGVGVIATAAVVEGAHLVGKVSNIIMYFYGGPAL